jgi:hypothetical protein
MPGALGAADAATASPALLAGLNKEDLLEVVFDLQRAVGNARADAAKLAAVRENELNQAMQALRVQVRLFPQSHSHTPHTHSRTHGYLLLFSPPSGECTAGREYAAAHSHATLVLTRNVARRHRAHHGRYERDTQSV